MRVPILAAACVSMTALLPCAGQASEATTTRIETRPFYGATVTLEAGVRVFRPLPPHSKVIINPGGKTPVNLGFEENNWVSHNHNYHHNAPRERDVEIEGAPVGGFFADGHRRRHGRSPHRGRGAFGKH